MTDLRWYLDDLEDRIDPGVEDQLLAEWRAFTDGRFTDAIFTPTRPKQSPPGVDWPSPTINACLEDVELMLLAELKGCSQSLAVGSGALLNIRANYGTCILSSLFGVEIFYMEESLNTLPTNRPLPGGADAMLQLVEHGVPRLDHPYAGRVFKWARFAKETLSDYPKINKYVQIYHPDVQGPMDICELIWGSSLFIDIIDHPELVKRLLAIINQTYKAYMNEWATIVPLKADYSSHWGLMHKGALMIRDDSAMNFSPDMFDEFIRPYDQELLNEFGGGAIHFCGRGSHYIQSMCEMDQLFAINMSQPSYNDMEAVYANTVDKNIKLLGFSRNSAENAIAANRSLRSNVHCR